MADEHADLALALQSGSPAERREAAERLAQSPSAARQVAVALVETCDTDDDQLREWIAAALEESGPPDVGGVARLRELVEHPRLDVAYWAATLLGRLAVDAAPAVPQLARALDTHPEPSVRERAAWALGRIGPPAAAAREALTRAADNSSGRLARLAQQALDRLR